MLLSKRDTLVKLVDIRIFLLRLWHRKTSLNGLRTISYLVIML